MYLQKYLKYRNKNTVKEANYMYDETRANLHHTIIGGNPINDFKLMHHNDEDKIIVNNNNLCNDIESIDVSRISTITLLQYYPFPENPPRTPPIMYFHILRVNKIYNFTATSIIGSGSYGVVISYIHTDDAGKKIGMAVKYGDVRDDVKILDYMKHRNICGTSYVNTLDYKYSPVADKIQHFLIMDHMVGTLEDYLVKNNFNLDYKIIKNIFVKVVSQMYCLSKYKLYYTDIKTTNILYKCNKNELGEDIIDIVLGDIGSITNANIEGKKVAMATFPPPDRCANAENCGEFLNPDEKDVVWGCAMLLLRLINCNTEPYTYAKIGTISQQNLISIINNSIAEVTRNLQINNADASSIKKYLIDDILTRMLKS